MISLNFLQFPVLYGKRLILRHLSMNDIMPLNTLRSNALVNRYIERAKSPTLNDTQKSIENLTRGVAFNEWIYWTICLQESNLLIGTICLWNFDILKSQAEIGYELFPEFQGQGLMQEAIDLVLPYAFDTLKINVILAYIQKENEKSIQLIRKNKFLLDSTFTYVSQEELGLSNCYFLLRSQASDE